MIPQYIKGPIIQAHQAHHMRFAPADDSRISLLASAMKAKLETAGATRGLLEIAGWSW